MMAHGTRSNPASNARVAVTVDAAQAVLTIDDDGSGASIVPGNGLEGMRERLRALGGDLEIRSTRGRGTCLLARLPMPPAARISDVRIPG